MVTTTVAGTPPACTTVSARRVSTYSQNASPIRCRDASSREATGSPAALAAWCFGAAIAIRCLRSMCPCNVGMVNLPWHVP